MRWWRAWPECTRRADRIPVSILEMRIGIVATRLAGVDGVTFETAKWEIALERMGHEVRLCAGEVDALRASARLVPPMHFAWPPAARVTAAAFDPNSDPVAVRAEIERLADLLVPVLDNWIESEHLDQLIVENAWAIPMHLPLGLALRRGGGAAGWIRSSCPMSPISSDHGRGPIRPCAAACAPS